MALNMLPGLTSCQSCPLHENGFVVPGDGPVPARVMVLGEAPGADENKGGRPFTGSAGMQLNKLLEIAGFKREDIYLTNSAKHWPGEGNPKPKANVIKACRLWLDWEIEMVDPEIIIALGSTAANNLIPGTNIKKAHGRGFVVEIGGKERTVYVVYHPAAGLHSPGLKPTIAKDFEEVKKWIAEYPEMEVGIIEGGDSLRKMVERCHRQSVLAVDLETTSLDVQNCQISSMALSPSSTMGFTSQNISLMIKVLQDHLDAGGLVVAHNSPFDLPILQRYGLELTDWTQVWDTMNSGYILGAESLALKSRILREHGYLMETFKAVAGKAKDASEIDPWLLLPYNACDTAMTYLLYETDKKEIQARNATEAMEIETKLTPLYIHMGQVGMRYDREKATTLQEELSIHMEELVEKAHGLVGQSFNINSTEAVAHLLFNVLKLKPVKKTDGGAWSTDEEVLKSLQFKHPVAGIILEYRKYQKMKSTYVDSVLKLSEADGRVHTRFKQTGARGGRASSEHPNLQNQPSRGIWGKKIKDLYIPEDKDHVFVELDYSQLELRVAAALSRDAAMIDIFKRDESIHMHTLRNILHSDKDKSSDDYKLSKNVNFGMTYRMSAAGLRRYLAVECDPPLLITMKEAIRIRENFLAQFPGLIAYQDKVIEEIMERGWVQNIFGHRRYLPEVFCDDKRAIEDALKVGVNLPIQGTAGVITKAAIVEIDRELGDIGIRNTVHDSIIVDCYRSEARDVAEVTEWIMVDVAQRILDVPVKVEWSMGDTWGGCH